jgi:hypothetical protein
VKKAQHLARTGKRRLPESRINLALRRLDQAMHTPSQYSGVPR